MQEIVGDQAELYNKYFDKKLIDFLGYKLWDRNHYER